MNTLRNAIRKWLDIHDGAPGRQGPQGTQGEPGPACQCSLPQVSDVLGKLHDELRTQKERLDKVYPCFELTADGTGIVFHSLEPKMKASKPAPRKQTKAK